MGQGYFLKRQRTKRFLTIFLFLLWGYLSFHLVVSERSVSSLMSLSAQENILDQQLAAITSEKEQIHDRVTRLRPDTLDMDLVQEQAVLMLGRTKGDTIILLDDNS
jgi:cell division protein FtsB